MMASPTQTAVKSSTLDGLPKSFVQVLRTLFDILDDKHTGLVKFSDIEARWQEDGISDLPKGVIESLRKVTPANGLLTFERFCAGLKICLLRNQMESRNKSSSSEKSLILPSKDLSQRPPSAPILDMFESTKCSPVSNENQWNKCPLPINQLSNTSRQNQKRTLSMPQLPSDSASKEMDAKETNTFQKQHSSNGLLLGPPKPPRSNVGAAVYYNQRPENTKTDKTEIRVALENWRLGFMSEDKQMAAYRAMSNVRSLGDGKGVQDYAEFQSHKKVNNRRREPRRHTLQNGIDCNMLKKIKQIESEKDILLDGLQAVECAREWYRKQLAIIQDKMKYIGRTGSQEQWSEAQQERIELLRARVLEVNRHLATLGSNSGDNKNSAISDGLPLHMNLAVQSQSRISHMQVMNQLKRQNHVLTKENSHKDEKIKNLEREKAALIRELYQVGRKSESIPSRKSQNGNENVPVATPAYI